MRRKALLISLCVFALCSSRGLAGITFAPGNYYTTNPGYYPRNKIIQYSAAGEMIGTLTLPSNISTIYGMAFGPDGLLYVSTIFSDGTAYNPTVLAIDNQGTIQQAYQGWTPSGSNPVNFGKIDMNNQFLYVAGGGKLFRFVLGDPNSGVPIYTDPDGIEIMSVKIEPNGNVFAGCEYGIREITNSGTFIREIPFIRDNKVARYIHIRGIEYDPVTAKLFVCELGDSGFGNQLCRVNAQTGVLEKNVDFIYGSDLFVDLAGDILGFSADLPPTFFSADLDKIGTLPAVSNPENDQSGVANGTRFVPWPVMEGLPPDVTIEATGPQGASVSFSPPTSTDLEGNMNVVVSEPASGSTFPLGTTPVNFTATNRQSHTTTAKINITVQDTTPPVIEVPNNIVVTKVVPKKHRSAGAVVFFNVSASDAVDGEVTAIANRPSGSMFPFGTTIVTVNASDSHGNVATPKTFSVSVIKKTKKKKHH